MGKKRRFAVISSKFHGGGILFRTSSPRQAYRWRLSNHDGCHEGRGCETFAVLMGDDWYPCFIAKEEDYMILENGLSQTYSDATYQVRVFGVPIRPASQVACASCPAL